MTWIDSISAPDRDLMKRLTIVLAFIFAFLAAFSSLERLYSRKFFDATGRAEWIWAHHPMNSNVPVAFFAVREVNLPERRLFTRMKVLGDPEYTLYVNGREVAGRRLDGAPGAADADRTLGLYDLSDLVTTGVNRFVIAVRSPQGRGGLIAALDLGPETQNWIVTNGEWRIYRRWHPTLLERDPPGLAWERPLILGEPPVGRWNYLAVESAPRAEPAQETIAPHTAAAIEGLIPTIRTSGGVAVAVDERNPATLFDFGFTSGRVRLTLEEPSEGSRSVLVRFANHVDEVAVADWNLRPFVFAPGERAVTTSEAHGFRYVMVFDRGARAEVVR